MARRRKRAKKSNFLAYCLVTLGFGLLIAAVGGIIYWQLTNKNSNQLDANLCPINSEVKGHYVIIVDQTDPYNVIQQQSFKLKIQKIITRIPKDYLISLYTFGAKLDFDINPVIELCNPGDGVDLSELTHNVKKIKRRYSDNFITPMLAQIKEINTSIEDDGSPILEFIQLVNLKTFLKDPEPMEKRMILVSDLIQNSKNLNIYRNNKVQFSQFSQLFSYQKVKSDLSDVKVDVLLLNRRPKIQNRAFISFWEQFFFANGASLESVELLEG